MDSMGGARVERPRGGLQVGRIRLSWIGGRSEKMTDSGGRERRKFQRIPMEQIVSFSHLGQLDQMGQGINLSTGGISFQVVACEINLGDQLRLDFSIMGKVVSATGTVVWATEVDALTLEVGLEFAEIGPRDRALLAEFDRLSKAGPEA